MTYKIKSKKQKEKICGKCYGIISKDKRKMGYKTYSSRWSKYCICEGRIK
jgi:hypothetical protein